MRKGWSGLKEVSCPPEEVLGWGWSYAIPIRPQIPTVVIGIIAKNKDVVCWNVLEVPNVPLWPPNIGVFCG